MMTQSNEWRLQPRSSVLDLQDFDRAFAALPSEARDPEHCAPPPPESTWQTFLSMPVPFATEFWLAFEEGTPVGRVGANLSPTRPHTGYLGFFEILNAPNAARHAGALLQAACSWLRKQGVRQVHGPIDFTTWFTYRFRLPTSAGSPRVWEPTNPPRYLDYFRDAKMTECMRYQSKGLQDLMPLAEATLEAFARCHRKGFRFLQLTPERLAETLPVIYDLSMRGFAGNYLFEPIGFEAFELLYAPLAAKGDGVFAHLAYAPDGTAAGFFMAFADGPDLILKSATVLPAYQGLGLSNAMMHVTCTMGAQAGLQRATTALVRCGGRSESYARKSGHRWVHDYVLFEKDLLAEA